ncbi:unnamed protein product [Didymodactylos carnosus]|uniref:Uncharacterized protein n=1 Tax=Didymodactylos carnosus TaxID=1234261 RepID=A0A815GVP8_9BILA|nr:unnamed protein product [Didymodactylos carnosus]CAF1345517.1 unnamed protein product [Didymodactylos carnosus]CAF3985948.1 unnamed protein product [Didymodactylos carnosus]CAF4210728.1 unnamed protein product [Didymodactylos carnosus]
MAYLQATELGLKDTTAVANVPENDTAKCMYYLNCVCYCIEYNDNDIQRYCDYKNYHRLTADEQRLVFVLCATLSPDNFDQKVFFQSDELSGSMSGRFYEVTQVRNRVLAVESIIIAGRTRQVKRIMTYKEIWMKNYYIDPMLRLAQRFGSQRRTSTRSCIIS